MVCPEIETSRKVDNFDRYTIGKRLSNGALVIDVRTEQGKNFAYIDLCYGGQCNNCFWVRCPFSGKSRELELIE